MKSVEDGDGGGSDGATVGHAGAPPAPEANPFPSIAPVRSEALPGLRPFFRQNPMIAIAVGGILGAALATTLTVTAMRHARRAAPVAAGPSFDVEPGAAVKLRAGSYQPLRFDTRQAELGAPLPRPPVTARVATLETNTSPSFAPLEGRVVETAARIGSEVKEGDKLVLIRTGELAELKRAKQAAELSISTKQALLTRVERLIESRAASQNDLLLAESELNESKLSARAGDARLRALSIRQEGDVGYWVLANRAGTVVQLDAAPGKEVGPDKDKPVATVAELADVLVLADLPQRDAGGLVAGMPVAIRFSGAGAAADAITGVLESVSAVLDPDRQTIPVRIRAKNEDSKLRPNTFVEATFLPKEGTRVVLVPTEAAISDGSTSVVFVETEPGVYRRRVVQLGRQTRDKTEVLKGLDAGEKVVVRGALLLLNAVGDQVK
jgi:cobalt-zinc-cadmium efflux system membrane fusion protein